MMSNVSRRVATWTMPAAAVLAAALAAAPAAAQTAPAANSTSWFRYCAAATEGAEQICFVQRDLFTDIGQALGSVTVRQVAGAPEMFLVQTPLGIILPPGLAIVIDSAQPQQAVFDVCLTTGCYARIDIDANFVNALKRGNNLIVNALNSSGNTISFEISLIGFTAAYDGAPLTEAQLLEREASIRATQQQLQLQQQQQIIDAQNAQRQQGTP